MQLQLCCCLLLIAWIASVVNAAALDAVAIVFSATPHSFAVGITTTAEIYFATPPSLTPYSVIIEWGEYSPAALPVVTVLGGPLTASRASATYTYLTAGPRAVNVTVSTGSVTWITPLNQVGVPAAFVATDADGSLSTTLSFPISVLASPPACYSFIGSIAWSVDTLAASLLLKATALVQLVDPTGAISSSALTNSAYASGMAPILTVYNDTISSPVTKLSWSASRMGWLATVPGIALLSPSLVAIDVNPNGASIMGCAVRGTTVPISPAAVASVSGFGVPALSSVPKPSTGVTSLKLTPHPCRPSHHLAWVLPQTSTNTIWHTTDHFASTTAVSLSTALCGSTCPTGFTVYDATFVMAGDQILWLTSNGLYVSTAAFGSAKRLTTESAALDSPSGSITSALWNQCYSDTLVLKSALAVHWVHTSAVLTAGAWSTMALASGTTVLAVFVPDVAGALPTLVLGPSTGTAAPTLVTVVAGSTAGGTTIAASFPSTVTVTPTSSGITGLHRDGSELHLILDATLLASIDGGVSWRIVDSMPSTAAIISSYSTSRTRNAMAVASAAGGGIVAVGRSGSAGLVALASAAGGAFGGTLAPSMAVAFDAAGDLWTITAYSADGTSLSLVRRPIAWAGAVQSAASSEMATIYPQAVAPGLGRQAPWAGSSDTALALVAVGLDEYKMYAASVQTGEYVPAAWKETAESAVITLADGGGSLLITYVASDGTFALAHALGSSFSSMALASGIASPAVPLDVVSGSDAVGSAGQISVKLIISSSAPAGSHWSTDIVGSTVMLNQQNSVLVTSILDAITVAGRLMDPYPMTLPALGITDWSVFDFRSAAAAGMGPLQTFSFSPASLPTGVTVTITTSLGSAGAVPFSRSHVGMYLVVNGGAQVLRMVGRTSSTVARAVVVSNSGVSGAGPAYVFVNGDTLQSGVITWRKPWALGPQACTLQSLALDMAIDDVPVNFTTPVNYMSSLESLAFNVTAKWVASDPTAETLALQSANNVNLALTSSDLFTVQQTVDATLDRFDGTARASVQLDNNDDAITDLVRKYPGRSLPSVLAALTSPPPSIACTATLPSVRVLNGCSPSYRLVFMIPAGGTNGLLSWSDNMVFPDGVSQVYWLPTNYRPPSTLGVAVPNSTVIYNADPAAARYNDFFPVSKTTGSYQACLGKTSRAECGCRDDQAYSFSYADSDCTNRVLAYYQQNDMILSFSVTRDLVTYIPVNTSITITELNRRTDWCIADAGGSCTAPDLGAFSAPSYPAVNSSIHFKGSELYHFRATVPIGTYCSLETDFPVFIINATPLPAVQQSVMSLTAVSLCFMFLTIYLWYSYKQV